MVKKEIYYDSIDNFKIDKFSLNIESNHFVLEINE